MGLFAESSSYPLRARIWPHFSNQGSFCRSEPRDPSTTKHIYEEKPCKRLQPTAKMSMINAKNKVTEHQRFYQQAYKAHTRLWMINPRSRWYMAPYLIALWGGFGATLYAASRKVAGHNTWFSKD